MSVVTTVKFALFHGHLAFIVFCSNYILSLTDAAQ